MRISDWSSDVCSSDLQAMHMLGRIVPTLAVGELIVGQVGAEQLAAIVATQIAELAAQLQAPLGHVARRQGGIVIRCQIEIIRQRELGPARAGRTVGRYQKARFALLLDRKRWKSTRLNSSH